MPFPPDTESVTVIDTPLESGSQTRNAPRAITRWWVAFAASCIFVVSGHLLIKAGLNAAAASTTAGSVLVRLSHLLLQIEVLAGLAIYFLGSVCWMIAVAQQEISFLYPLSSVNYMLVMVASSLILHELISPKRAAGVVLIVLGMFLMNRNGKAQAR